MENGHMRIGQVQFLALVTSSVTLNKTNKDNVWLFKKNSNRAKSKNGRHQGGWRWVAFQWRFLEYRQPRQRVSRGRPERTCQSQWRQP
jgi:hypothetical protein